MFDAAAKERFADSWPALANDLQRHDTIHTALDLLAAPILVTDWYSRLRQDWCSILDRAFEVQRTATLRFAADSQSQIVTCQQRLFHCLELFIQHRSAWLPALAAEMYPAGSDLAISQLRLFRDDFPALRDLYLSSFEPLHHGLTHLVGTINIAERGAPGSFPAGSPTDLAAFAGLPEARKLNHLAERPVWHTTWPRMLDRDLRDAIGHHSVRHDLPSGQLESEGRPRVPYLQFVLSCLRLIHPMLATANVLKSLRIVADFV